MKIGFLSTLNNFFVGRMIRECLDVGIYIDAVFLDEKDVTEKDKSIHEERTGGRFDSLPLYVLEDACIPFYLLKNHNNNQCISLSKELQLDLLVNAGTPRIIKKNLLAAPSRGVVNCHPGLLPGFRGCTCVEWAIYLDRQVGSTVHFMTQGIDDGPIVLKESLTFSQKDNYMDVRIKVYNHQISLLARGLKKIIDEEMRPEDLPEQGKGNYYSVIDQDKMVVVIEKLAKGEYKYQVGD